MARIRTGTGRSIQRLDPATGKVEVIGKLPRPLSAAAALVVDGHLLVLGGRHGGKASNAILEVDPATGDVTRAGHLPYPVANAGAAVVDDTGYLVGGEGDALKATVATTVTLSFPPPVPAESPSANPAASVPPVSSPAALGPSPSPDVYAAITSGQLAPSVANMPERVYVPNEKTGNVVVIDPATFKIIDRFKVGSYPEHIAPAWDLSKLYVDNMKSSSLTVIDPTSGRPVGTQKVAFPYNLYFTLDGSKAIVVLDFRTGRNGSPALNRLDFYDRLTWQKLGSLVIPWGGADHLDMSADGSYLLLSTEFAGVVVKVDTTTMKVVGHARVGGLPIDVRLSPDGSVFYVTNQLLNGVSIIDPVAMQQIGFIPTAAGAHGLVISRDATRLYVSNRLAGTISVIDPSTQKVVDTWHVGGSPDMLTVSTDGSQLWTSNRYDGSVSVIDTATGKVLKVIKTGDAPHGLVYYPQPGNLSLGHNGVFR